MMVRYKLLQWYPTLPENWEAGMEVKKVSEPGTCFKDRYIPTNHKYKVKYIDSKEIENNPGFWEKVKDYEVLKVTCTTSDYRIKDNLLEPKENGLWQWEFNSTGTASLETLLDIEEYTIYSIKRLSDGVVFTIGDKICCNWVNANVDYFTIDKLYVEYDELYMNTVEESCQNFNLSFNNSSRLNKLKHYKETLFTTFTTEDGFKLMYSSDFRDMWGVALQASGKDVLKTGWNEGISDNNTPPTNRKWFWLRHNAEEYIELNTKRYSKQDVMDAVGKVGMFGAENSPDGSSKEVILLTKDKLFKQLDI